MKPNTEKEYALSSHGKASPISFVCLWSMEFTRLDYTGNIEIYKPIRQDMDSFSSQQTAGSKSKMDDAITCSSTITVFELRLLKLWACSIERWCSRGKPLFWSIAWKCTRGHPQSSRPSTPISLIALAQFDANARQVRLCAVCTETSMKHGCSQAHWHQHLAYSSPLISPSTWLVSVQTGMRRGAGTPGCSIVGLLVALEWPLRDDRPRGWKSGVMLL